MKWNLKSNYIKLGLTAFLIIAASMFLYLILFRNASLVYGFNKVVGILNPILYGFMIAYMMNPAMQVIENLILTIGVKLKWKPGRRARSAVRIISTFLAATLIITIIYALISRIIPELIDSIKSIMISFPVYVDNINDWISSTFHNDSMDEKTTALINEYAGRFEEWLDSTLIPQLDDVLATVRSSIKNVLIFFKNLFLGFIISMYVLINKERIKARTKRIIYALFSITTANRILRNMRFVDKKFGGFLIGKIIDSFIIGIIAYFSLIVLKMPYPLLIAIVIGITNIIPFFGPFIGAIPSAFLIFVVNPIQALYFLIFIVVLQQIDGNFIGPKILGSSVGVSSFMVLVAITIGAGFFGVPGMVIGVPLFAILAAILQSFILKRTITKRLPGDLESYLHVWYMDPETRLPVNERTRNSKMSLYEAIKRRSPEVEAMDHPLTDNPWDKTEAEVRRDIEINIRSMESEKRSEKVSNDDPAGS